MNEQENYGALSFRATIRDNYAAIYNRGFILDRMALMDYDLGYMSLGRIQIVEKIALQEDYLKPHRFEVTAEEQHYIDWLRKVVNGESGNQLFRNIFFHGVSSEMELLVSGEVA